MNPLISIIVPIYNVEAYLPKCLDSILSQTYRNLEIILVDDASRDRCGILCEEYARRDPRIQVIHKEHAGLGYARNSGIAVSTGEYLMFVDSDDYLADTAVQALYDRLAAEGTDFAIGKNLRVFPNGRQDSSPCDWMEDTVLSVREVLRQREFPVTAWGKLYRRELFDGIQYPNLTCSEDTWVIPDLLSKCRNVSIVDSLVYYYYQRPDSITHSMTEQMKQDRLKASLRMTQFLLQSGELNAARIRYPVCLAVISSLQDKKNGIAQLKQALDPGARRQLFQGITLLRWVAIYCPPLRFGLSAAGKLLRFFRKLSKQ